MRTKSSSSFQQSHLGRAKTKRNFLGSLVDSKLKQPGTLKRRHTTTGLPMDTTSPTTVVRIIMGLIAIHFVVIGGLMMRGNIGQSERGMAVAPTITPPPAPPAPIKPEAPLQPAAAQPAVVTQPAPANTQVHITQAPVNMEAVTAVTEQAPAPVQPVAVQPQPAQPAPAATPTVNIPHLVQSGDTWGRIAAHYGITEDVLKGANTQQASLTNPPGGTYLNVPVPEGSAAAQAARAATPVVPETAKYHVVKRGENLGRIARKYDIPLQKLLKMNNMTNADARRLQVGHKLKVSE